MLKQKDIMDCLPLLASVLGNQYGVTVEISGSEAYTDGKTIHLPALPLDSEPELITMIKGYLDHESAHIRETDFGVLKQAQLTPFQYNLFNILEDYRVEERLSVRYPGCRENFRYLIQKLFGEEKVGDNNPAFSVLNTILLTVRSWAVDSIIPHRDAVAKTMEGCYPGLLKVLDEVLDKVLTSCKDTHETIQYALELEQVIRQWSPEQPEPEQEKDPNDNQDAAKGSMDSLSGMLNASTPDDLPKGFGETLAKEIEESSSGSKMNPVSVASIAFKRSESLSPARIAEIGHQTAGLSFRLQGLVQAPKWLPAIPGTRGRLSSSLCHRLAAGNPSVFIRQDFQEAPNTAIHLLLDTSGSMSNGALELANGVCYAVGKALQGIAGINLGITAFPGGRVNGNKTTVAPVLRHGEKLSNRFPKTAYGLTPLAEALWWVMQQMCFLREERKIILIITDGEPDSVSAATEALGAAQKKDFECYGLGIMSSEIAALLPHTSRVIDRLPQLAPALFALLEGALRKRV